MFEERESYPLSTWMIDLCEIIERREFMNKKTTLLLMMEELPEILELYESGLQPQGAYDEYFRD